MAKGKRKENIVKGPVQPKAGETTAQRLSAIIKSCRNIMRKDKGLNGDGDRLPMLTWIMFLKFLDDNEQLLEVSATLDKKKYKSAIESPYRWRDWAKDKNLTGDDLLVFISNEKVKLKDGKEAPGLFYYLRGLQSESGRERKDVIATVFKGVNNRMINGFLLREAIDKIDEIHFTNNEELNTLSHLYESILKEMRDASGDAGEFYTPRPVVKFMVEMVNPQLNEIVLDPAAGTGGFLVQAFEHLKKQTKIVEQRNILQNKSIIGGEPKTLPYLLCQMNLLLHGLEYPNIDSGNSLRLKLGEIGDNSRVDVIITNPPFGGEEESSILKNFPADKQTAETAMLFLQLIMRKLRRAKPGQKGGRAAMVVPNGTLFDIGIPGKIKEQLLSEFNLHTIVRLGEGIFSPYTDIPSNLLFFEHGSATQEIWYYELTPPAERKKYSKTRPIQSEEFEPVKQWWFSRSENETAWKVNIAEVIKLKESEATAYWNEAEAQREKARELKTEIGELKSKNSQDQKITLKLKEQTEAERTAREKQQEGDGIYYSAFNLDLKNPNRKSEFEYREPSELINSIMEKEKRVMQLMEEIQETIQESVSNEA